MRAPLLRSLLLAVTAVVALTTSCAPPSTGVDAQPQWFTSVDMGRSLPVREGIDQSVVDAGGLAWDPLSARLGSPGTTVLFGHRSGYGSPLLTIDRLQPGDIVELRGADQRTYLYRVALTRVVEPTWDAILAWTPATGKGLALVSCHPIGSTAQRIVVQAELDFVI